MAYDSGIGEQVSRFITDKSYFRSSNNTVRHNAFMPAKDGKLSVYRTSVLAEADIWQLGQAYVSAPRQKPLLGRADINSLQIYGEGLAIEGEPVPHERHANVVGWDPDATNTRLIAVKLAAASALVMID